LPGQPLPVAAAGPFDPPGVTWQRVSGRLITARLIGLSITFGLMAVGFAIPALVAVQLWAWIVVAAVLVMWLLLIPVVIRQVRAIRYAERDDDLLIRKGIMFRSLVVVPYGRMQYVDVQAGPLARGLRIATVQLHTAAAGTNASISGLEPGEAERLRDRLASQGEAKLAGL
jgi:membrane protein YdbS with pleckstrin-like domain